MNQAAGTALLAGSLLGSALFSACFMLPFCLTYSSTLKMVAICSSETLIDFRWTMRRFIPEERTFRLSA
jgi:hypothetical protein